MAASNYFQQTTGPRAGQYYHLIQSGGNNYRRYDDGTTVLVPAASSGPGTAWNPGLGYTPPAAPAATASPPPSGPAQSTVPATPGPPSIAPFANAQDNIGLAGATQNTALQTAQINQGVGDLAANTAWQVAQNDKTALRNTTDEKDVAASHGLFNSSIKDGALADIEAQRTIQNTFLTDALSRAQANAATNSGILSTGLTAYQTAYNQQRVENAQSIADTIQPPTPASPATPAPATPAAPHPASPNSGTGSGGIGGWRANEPVVPQAAQPASGFQFVQHEGTRAGMSYNVIQHGGTNIRVYSNGDRIPVP